MAINLNQWFKQLKKMMLKLILKITISKTLIKWITQPIKLLTSEMDHPWMNKISTNLLTKLKRWNAINKRKKIKIIPTQKLSTIKKIVPSFKKNETSFCFNLILKLV